MTQHRDEPQVDPTVGADGDMGVSSERVDATGESMGTRDTSAAPAASAADDAPPEQSPGGAEVHPDAPVPPVSGYSSSDPRSDDKPYEPR